MRYFHTILPGGEGFLIEFGVSDWRVGFNVDAPELSVQSVHFRTSYECFSDFENIFNEILKTKRQFRIIPMPSSQVLYNRNEFTVSFLIKKKYIFIYTRDPLEKL